MSAEYSVEEVLAEMRKAADESGATMGKCFQWWRILSERIKADESAPTAEPVAQMDTSKLRRCFQSLEMLKGSRHAFGEVYDHPEGCFVRREDVEKHLATHPHSPDAADSGRVDDEGLRSLVKRWREPVAGYREEDSYMVGYDHACKHLALELEAALAAQGQGDSGPGFGLMDGDVAALRDAGLKPEEIAGDAVKQQERVSELVHWFARFLRGSANPKWLASHAMELAYYIATNADNRHIDVGEIRKAGFKEGLNVTPEERAMLERIGVANPAPPASPAGVPDDRLQKAIGALLWINEEVWPLVHGLTCRETLRKRFRELPNLIDYLAAAPSAPEGGEVGL